MLTNEKQPVAYHNGCRGARCQDVFKLIVWVLAVFFVCGMLAVFVSMWKVVPVWLWLGISTAISSAIASCYFGRWLQEPDIVTKHGTAIWSDGVGVTKEAMEAALDRFLVVVTAKAPKLAPEVTAQRLHDMLSATGIEWQRQSIDLDIHPHGWRHEGGDQKGCRIRLQWRGSINGSALYHYLLHEVNETIRLPLISEHEMRVRFMLQDAQHAATAWWALENDLLESKLV